MSIRSTKTSPTPDDLAIVKRDMKFGRGNPPPRWWHSNDPGRTAFFNALSSSFPLGEKFFMTAVRYYREQADEPLRSQIGVVDTWLVAPEPQGWSPQLHALAQQLQARSPAAVAV